MQLKEGKFRTVGDFVTAYERVCVEEVLMHHKPDSSTRAWDMAVELIDRVRSFLKEKMAMTAIVPACLSFPEVSSPRHLAFPPPPSNTMVPCLCPLAQLSLSSRHGVAVGACEQALAARRVFRELLCSNDLQPFMFEFESYFPEVRAWLRIEFPYFSALPYRP